MYEKDTFTKKEFDIAIEMTLGHILAHIFKQCTVWTTKEININKTV